MNFDHVAPGHEEGKAFRCEGARMAAKVKNDRKSIVLTPFATCNQVGTRKTYKEIETGAMPAVLGLCVESVCAPRHRAWCLS